MNKRGEVMKRTYTIILTTLLVALFAATGALAQEAGDFRSAAQGDWDATATWETFDGADWVAAASVPDGSENISIIDSVFVVTSVSVSGEVTVTGDGVLTVDEDTGDLTFADGSTYEHGRDGGSVPESTWDVGSTFSITGTTGDAPGDRGQDYHHIVLNTPDKSSNTDLDLAGHTIGGDITVVSTGSSRWYLMGGSSGTGEEDISVSEVTIMGNVTVEDGQFATQGTSSAYSEYNVNHHGSVNVTGGNFSIARGSQSGLGTTTWNFLTDGASFTMADAETQSSNPEGATFAFAANGTQTIDFSNVDYGSRINWSVSDTTTLEIADGTEFTATGILTNAGVITATGTIIVDGDGTYDHARNGGDIPDITWEDGSTAILSGITTDAPGNRGQNYYNLTLNTPGLASNRDLDMDGVTIGGDLRVIDSGSARWRLFGGSAGTVTIMGDVIVEGGDIETNGTGSNVDQVIDHHGNIVVTGGTFAISRGSMGDGTPENTGTVTWNIHEGDFSVSDARVRNSISLKGNAKFVFASDTVQTLTIGENVTFDQLPVEIAAGATLGLGESVIEGNDVFIINGNVATSLAGGFEAALQTSGDITVGGNAGFLYNGSVAQTAGLVNIADSVGAVIIANAEGVSFNDLNNDSLYVGALSVNAGALLNIGFASETDTAGTVFVDSGMVAGTIVNAGIFDVSGTLSFGAESSYEHARDGGEVPSGIWAEGSTAIITGTVTNAPGNRGQDYYNLTLNTPDLVSNSDLSLHGNTVYGDIHVVSTGVARWYLTSPSGDAEVTREVILMGDVTMEAGQFSTNGSGNPGDIVIHHYGSAIVNDGNFSVSRGSQASGTSSTNWYFYEGDFTLNDGSAQNSNSDNAQWVFAGGPDVVHTYTLSEEFSIDGSGMQMIVSDSSSLDLGESVITSGGDFTAEGGSTLLTSHVEGFDGNLQMTGILSLSNEGNFTFNGTGAQITSFTLPLVVNGLTIDNEAGVTQSRGITINGFLRLAAGVFDNTVGFTLGEDAEVIVEDGSLLIPLEGEEIPIPEPPYDVGDNLSYNGSFSETDLGDTEADAWFFGTSAESSVEIVDDAQDGDERALEFNVSWNGSANWYENEVVNEPLNVVEGEIYLFSVWLKADSDTRIARPYIGLPASGGWERRPDFNTPEVELSTEYEQWTMEWTANADDEEHTMRLGIEFNAEVNDGATIYVDSLAVTKLGEVSNEVDNEIPNEFTLNQNYPNPFNPTTTISYGVPEAADVTLKVYDITGREVAELVNTRQAPGTYSVEWNAEQFATGVYLYRITAGNFTAVRKLTLIK